ncbi:MAG: DNA-3-methyladenine glycosylase [Deltaproteobacteria bacterium]|nr:DNA-3-methyladenine glycosylase [Deltaproteobacteria bacterium]MBI3294759.1 DNA-3-methyladenine glycosylase [Deltaproteobacteria bacterium]
MKPSEHNFQKVLPSQFYLRDTLTVARSLIGKGLVVRSRGELLAVEITETEAYLGQRDPASHSYHGPTARNRSMFEGGGTCYVYLSYGMHYCMNVVTGPVGVGEAVLIRAARPILGEPTFFKNRKTRDPRLLMNGPGKLAQALGINLSFDGETFSSDRIRLVNLGRSTKTITATPRIGISQARELPYRFLAGEV